MIRKRFSTLFLAALSLLIVAPLYATTLLRLNLDQIAGAADVVVRVRCTSASTYMMRGTVWTRSDFSVLETWKGSPPTEIRVNLPGGRAGRIVVSIEAVPRFRPDEEGVLFLQLLTDGAYSVIGWAQGAFRIRRNESTGESMVTQDSSALAVYDPKARRFVNEGVRDLPLAAFRHTLAGRLPAAAQTRRGDTR